MADNRFLKELFFWILHVVRNASYQFLHFIELFLIIFLSSFLFSSFKFILSFSLRFFRSKKVNIFIVGRKERDLKTKPKTDTRISYHVSLLLIDQ